MNNNDEKTINNLIIKVIQEIGFTENRAKDLILELASIDEIYKAIDTITEEAINEYEAYGNPDIDNIDPENIVEDMNIPLLAQLKTLDYTILKKIVEKYGDNKHLTCNKVPTTVKNILKVSKEIVREEPIITKKKESNKTTIKRKFITEEKVEEKAPESVKEESVKEKPVKTETAKAEEVKPPTKKPFTMF